MTLNITAAITRADISHQPAAGGLTVFVFRCRSSKCGAQEAFKTKRQSDQLDCRTLCLYILMYVYTLSLSFYLLGSVKLSNECSAVTRHQFPPKCSEWKYGAGKYTYLIRILFCSDINISVIKPPVLTKNNVNSIIVLHFLMFL